MAVRAVPPSRGLWGNSREKRWRQGWAQRSHFWIDRMRKDSYKYAGLCIFDTGFCLMRGDIVAGNGTDPELGTRTRFRQGQILKLISSENISSQDELRRRLAHVKLQVTKATLSRDFHELKVVKAAAGYKPLTAVSEADGGLGRLGRDVRAWLVDPCAAIDM